MPSKDKKVCLTCTGSAFLNSEIMDCKCLENERLFETINADGTSGVKICEACAGSGDIILGTSKRQIYQCEVCPNEGEVYSRSSENCQCS